jgi:hypothetical protein
MSSRVVFRCTPLFNCKQLRSITAVELFKAVHGYSRSSGDKLQKTRSHLIVERQDNLEIFNSLDICYTKINLLLAAKLSLDNDLRHLLSRTIVQRDDLGDSHPYSGYFASSP